MLSENRTAARSMVTRQGRVPSSKDRQKARYRRLSRVPSVESVLVNREVITSLPSPAPAWPRFSYFLSRKRFGWELAREVQRHRRYLSGLALLRLWTEAPEHLSALRETLETETRSTDSLCGFADGSFALLAPEVDDTGAQAISERLKEVTVEIGADAGWMINPLVGLAVAGNRRITADEIWMDAEEDFRRKVEICVQSSSLLNSDEGKMASDKMNRV